MSLRVQQQNDAFRQGMFVNLNSPNAMKPAGKYCVSAGVHGLNGLSKALILAAVRNDTNFTEDNDPYGEHEFGVIELSGLPKVFWRIDYYADETLTDGGDPDEEDVYRLLTIYFADEH